MSMAAAGRFTKRYPSALRAEVAHNRAKTARLAGVATPAVLERSGPLTLDFERVVVAGPPLLEDMIAALLPLHRMPREGLTRFDPFCRILPRLGGASPQLSAMVAALQAEDRACAWAECAVVHGDFHPGQTLRDGEGRIWLVDLDDLALAPPEADFGNLAAWMATQREGALQAQVDAALTQVLALAPGADPALARHFCRIALLRRGLKLAEKGQPWVLQQLPFGP